MALYKKGKCDDSLVIVSSSVYACESCGHTEIASSDSTARKCPKCDSPMKLISSQTETS